VTVLAIALQEDGGVPRASLEALTVARGLATTAGVPLAVATIGPVADDAAAVLREHGAATVHALVHPRLDDFAPAAWAAALSERIHHLDPRAVVGPGTDRGNEVLAHLAARLDLPLAANCTEVAVDGDAWSLTRLRWGGVLLEDARLQAPRALLTVAPNQVVASVAEAPGAGEPVTVEVEVDEADLVGRVRERVARTQGISLATAPVVVSGGRGVGSAEGFAALEELAELLGGAVGCSRVATNAGWRSHNDQVGQTGTRVAPHLYIACGISGATQHWVGCMASKRILAINTDPEAPMVTRAHYAVVGDLHALLPALLDEVRRRKGKAA
jgi:electron transfer flavoprotein alpha subunit